MIFHLARGFREPGQLGGDGRGNSFEFGRSRFETRGDLPGKRFDVLRRCIKQGRRILQAGRANCWRKASHLLSRSRRRRRPKLFLPANGPVARRPERDSPQTLWFVPGSQPGIGHRIGYTLPEQRQQPEQLHDPQELVTRRQRIAI